MAAGRAEEAIHDLDLDDRLEGCLLPVQLDLKATRAVYSIQGGQS